MKKRTLYGKSTWYSNDEHNRGYQNIKKIEDKYRKKYPQILWENFDHRSHYKLHEELGLQYKKSSQELRSLFGWNLTSASKTIFKMYSNKIIWDTGYTYWYGQNIIFNLVFNSLFSLVFHLSLLRIFLI